MKMQFPIFGGLSTSPSNTASQVTCVNTVSDGGWVSAGSIATREIKMPIAMTVSTFHVEITTAPGVGITRTFTLMVNGVASAATVSFANTNAIQEWTGPALELSIGDTLSLQSDVAGGTAAGTGNLRWHLLCQATDYPIFGNNTTAGVNTNANEYLNPMGGYAHAGTTVQTDQEIVMPCAGTFDRFYMFAPVGSPGAGTAYTLTWQKNATDQTLTASITDTNVTGNDLTNSFAVAAGDRVVLHRTITGTPTARALYWCARFTPTTQGDFFTGFGSASNSSATATAYQQPLGTGNGTTWGATETAFQFCLPANVTIGAMYVSLGAAPTGANWCLLRVNVSASPSGDALGGVVHLGGRRKRLAVDGVAQRIDWVVACDH